MFIIFQLIWKRFVYIIGYIATLLVPTLIQVRNSLNLNQKPKYSRTSKYSYILVRYILFKLNLLRTWIRVWTNIVAIYTIMYTNRFQISWNIKNNIIWLYRIFFFWNKGWLIEKKYMYIYRLLYMYKRKRL